jgi:hypothetical protein
MWYVRNSDTWYNMGSEIGRLDVVEGESQTGGGEMKKSSQHLISGRRIFALMVW